jgi:hypothetical protein
VVKRGLNEIWDFFGILGFLVDDRDRERGWERRERKMLKSKGKSEEKKQISTSPFYFSPRPRLHLL